MSVNRLLNMYEKKNSQTKTQTKKVSTSPRYNHTSQQTQSGNNQNRSSENRVSTNKSQSQPKRSNYAQNNNRFKGLNQTNPKNNQKKQFQKPKQQQQQQQQQKTKQNNNRFQGVNQSNQQNQRNQQFNKPNSRYQPNQRTQTNKTQQTNKSQKTTQNNNRFQGVNQINPQNQRKQQFNKPKQQQNKTKKQNNKVRKSISSETGSGSLENIIKQITSLGNLNQYNLNNQKMEKLLFLKTLASPETNPFEIVQLDYFVIEKDYKGPKVKNKRFDMEFFQSMLIDFQEGKMIHKRYIHMILFKFYEIILKTKNVTYIDLSNDQEITVVGDLHGQFMDLFQILEFTGMPGPNNQYLFNGDLIDRGLHSLEVVLTVFLMKILFPQYVHINRGNHESLLLNLTYGFYEEVSQKIGGSAFPLFTEIFIWLPLATVINHKIFVVHGGLCGKYGVTIKDIEAIDRTMQPVQDPKKSETDLLSCLLWSDPGEFETGFVPNPRACSVMFGVDVTKDFLQNNNLELIVRSHEAVEDGYEFMHENLILTIFSAANYRGDEENFGAVVKFNSNSEISFHQFESEEIW
ncbi:serine/threonine-protein phosphatase [Anaeramoeba flamelloides]|uniref:Serine/threonine-protein phosphatase n=1 Tax=Anaeramoeba flamelloides TaxID=1746091 RepID=A0AAV7YBV4_9EUKA|nr:serine/threonine-protein phosphatase [Anaeramoeba flamelloides]